MTSHLFTLLGNAEMTLERNGVIVVRLMGSDGTGETRHYNSIIVDQRNSHVMDQLNGTSKEGTRSGWMATAIRWTSSQHQKGRNGLSGRRCSSLAAQASSSFLAFMPGCAISYTCYMEQKHLYLLASGVNTPYLWGIFQRSSASSFTRYEKNAWPPILGGMLCLNDARGEDEDGIVTKCFNYYWREEFPPQGLKRDISCES